MKRLVVTAAILLTACASASGATRAAAPTPAPAAAAAASVAATSPAKFPVVMKSADGKIEAHFDGQTPDADLKAPLRFGTSRLWFTFAGDKTAYEFKPKGTLEFPDWTFDVFSPNGEWVLLPQDHYGPYHVVATKNLKAYLQGKAAPDRVLGEKSTGEEQALVHLDGRWVSATEVEYKAGGETQVTRRIKVTDPVPAPR